jgi:hypothetical protein
MKATLIVLALMMSQGIDAPSLSEELKALFDADQNNGMARKTGVRRRLKRHKRP